MRAMLCVLNMSSVALLDQRVLKIIDRSVFVTVNLYAMSSVLGPSKSKMSVSFLRLTNSPAPTSLRLPKHSKKKPFWVETQELSLPRPPLIVSASRELDSSNTCNKHSPSKQQVNPVPLYKLRRVTDRR